MSVAGTPSSDPWVVVPREKARYEEQFQSLKPINGIVTGDQAKGFLLKSQLSPQILMQIWALADTDGDGRMNLNEFSIACKLINLKLRGYELPRGLPPSLLASLNLTTPPAIPPLPNPALVKPPSLIGSPLQATPPAVPIIPQQPLIPVATPPIEPPPIVSSTPRASLDRTNSAESLQAEWAVPHDKKLKYTQIFNTTDRTRSGFLSGAQARLLMVQSGLPQIVLAQIWALSDMDSDGKLGCDEFVLAMFLCEQAAAGVAPPTKLPLEMIPPSFRRGGGARTASISSQGSAAPLDQDPASTLLQTSFEDKRKENFEKGQAELERRRKALADQQRKEAEERERKEREELERKEKARQEAERKRLEELEKQMREQQEQERLKEEERKRQAEQREAARREMERQRQLEWEKQRLQELQQQRQREQETVLKLKAKNQSLTIEVGGLNDQVKELSQKICDTRVGVSNVKTTIDGMRSTRDAQMQDMSKLKAKLKEQNAKLLALSQEKVKLEAKNKLNTQLSGQDSEQARLQFENKEVTIKNLKEKIEDMQSQIDGKLSDIENNNSQLAELRTQLSTMVGECEKLYGVYETKRTAVMELKSNTNLNAAWKSDDAWGAEPTVAPAADWPVSDGWAEPTPDPSPAPANSVRYRALYEFLARNNDEITFQPGDIINVPKEQTGEPGWLAGEIRGHTGWFPESYVEPIEGVGVREMGVTSTTIEPEETEPATRLEEIVEVPEVGEAHPITEEEESYIATYPYQSQEQGDLTFNAGDVIIVVKKDGDWWTGRIGQTVGIFPSNYVQKQEQVSTDVVESTTVTSVGASQLSMGVSAEAVSSALEQAVSSATQADNEVSQINENKAERVSEGSVSSSAQILKNKKPDIASVIAPYQASSPEQLSLARGQLIMIRKKTDSGWWEGELQAKGRKRQVGWFPASYVKVLNSSGRLSGRTTPVSSSRMQQEVVIDKVVALFPYSAGNPDELSFAKDDIISVTAREEEAWWRGELNGMSGLFPSNYVTPLQQFVKAKSKRAEAIDELICTERAYISDMNVVHQFFEIPLRINEVITNGEIDQIFVNWHEIIACNKAFLVDLETRRKSGDDRIGDVLCLHLPLMTAYITFCSKQLDSASLLQNLTETSPNFNEFVKKCQLHGSQATKGMPLSSFLIKPMQRITKYPLLINKIIENTDLGHGDRKNLEQALQVAEQFLNSVNENVREKENLERLQFLQLNVQNELNIDFTSETNKLGPRRLVHHSNLYKIKTGKHLIGFLFNDFFMLVQSSKNVNFSFQRNTNVTYKLYKQPILIGDLVMTTEAIESSSDLQLKIQDNKTKYNISLMPVTQIDCGLWIKKVVATKEAATKFSSLSRRRKKAKSQPLTGGACGRLLVLVHKGKRFISVSVYHGGVLTVTIQNGVNLVKVQRKKRKNYGKTHCENVYVRVSLGGQEDQTDVSKDNVINGNGPQNGGVAPQVPALYWDHTMQFQVSNINSEMALFVVYEQNLFSPDVFLGKAEVKIMDLYRESQNTNGPITKKLVLHQVESGELLVKLDLQIFDNF